MASKALPPPEVLRQLIRYEPETGKLFWLARDEKWFGNSAYSKRSATAWNARFSGKEAFTAPDSNGYLHGHILGVKTSAHRLIWELCFSVTPYQVDHINGNRADNRLVNLRNAVGSDNNRNQKIPSTNKSGVIGVSWSEKPKRWLAKIDVHRRQIYLGYFVNFEDACRARKDAEREFGFHPNHGRAR